jgi:SAM-dependent methyltransferase
VNEAQSLKSESNPDSFQGMTWSDRAKYGVLGAVLDPGDKSGKKNAFIDKVQRTVLKSVLGKQHFRRALDFGCGTGRLLGFLAQHASEVYALDRTPEMLDVARRQHQMPDDRFVCWRDSRLSFDDGYFDLILSVGVLCAVLKSDFASIVYELQRTCAPGGLIVLIEQVDNARELTPSTYVRMFEDGFDVIATSPLRVSGSLFHRYAAKPWVPSFIIPALATGEILSMRRARFSPEAKRYWDYLFVFKKRQSNGSKVLV